MRELRSALQDGADCHELDAWMHFATSAVLCRRFCMTQTELGKLPAELVQKLMVVDDYMTR